MIRRVLILGASGRTGGELLRQGARCDYEITALARDPARVEAGVRVVAGDSTDGDAIEEAVTGQDAVLCALGPTSPTALLRSTLMRETTGALIPAMERHGVRRLVMLSALGAGASAGFAPAALRLAFATLLRRVGRDKAIAEAELAASGLDWTVVYPPALSDGAATGAYRMGADVIVKGVPKLSRADLAHAMLAQLSDAGRPGPVVVAPA